MHGALNEAFRKTFSHISTTLRDECKFNYFNNLLQ
jgi:hypothetical protein